MPFEVDGWVEVTSESPEERDEDVSLWTATLALGPFGLCGCPVSDFLFGLAKEPTSRGRYGHRGLPHDRSQTVERDWADWERFAANHGDGPHGYTHASLEEVRSALAAPEAPALEAEWRHLLAVVDTLVNPPDRAPLGFVRLVVWAVW